MIENHIFWIYLMNENMAEMVKTLFIDRNKLIKQNAFTIEVI